MSDSSQFDTETLDSPSEVEVETPTEESLQSKYLRWSVPSLVLAIVTAVLWFCSVVWTEPSIHTKYRQLSKSNIEKLRLNEPSFWISERAANIASNPPSPTEARRLIDETTLALRRLVILNTRDDWAHYQLGMVAAASASWYRQSLEGNLDADTKTQEKWRGEIVSAEKRARDEMSIVVGLGGEFAANAIRWSITDELRDLCFVTGENGEQVAKLQEQLSELSRKEKDVVVLLELRSWQAKLKVLRALSLSSKESIDERRKLLDDAREVFAENQQPSLECLSWHAESMVVSNPAGAIDKGREAVQLYFTSEEELAKSPLAIAAAFKNLLLVGAISEAESLIVKSISGPPTNHTVEVRNLASAAAFRQIQSVELGAAKPTKNLTLAKLLGISFRLAPNSEWVRESVKKITSASDDEGLWREIAEELGRSDDHALQCVFDSIIAAKQSENAILSEKLASLQKLEPGLFVSLASIVGSLIDNGVLDETAGGRVLRLMSQMSQEQMSVWFARVAFCSKYQQVTEEIECLEFLSTRVPENEQILARLQELRNQTNVDTK